MHNTKMNTQQNNEIILKIKCLHLERTFCTSPCYLRWGSSQPCHSCGVFLSGAHPKPHCTWNPHGSASFSPVVRAVLPSPSTGTEAWAVITLCSWRDIQLKLVSTACLWHSLQPPARAKQPEHTWEGKDSANSAAYGIASDYDLYLGFGSEIQRKAGRWAGSSILDQKFGMGIGDPRGLHLYHCIGWGDEEGKVTGRFWHFEIIDNLHGALVLFNIKSVTSGPVFQGWI